MRTQRPVRTCTFCILMGSFLCFFPSGPAMAAEIAGRTTAGELPRKVIVGTVMQPFWGTYPGLQHRLDQLTTLVDRLQARSEKQYARGLDLAVLPEMAVTGEGRGVGNVADWSLPLAGPLQDTFAHEARKCHCYIVVPTFLLEDRATRRCSNAAILFDRSGAVKGIYRKLHLVVDPATGVMEHGATPGKDVPVFACDFGKLGIQICYDMRFDYGWQELARQGAEVVAWPTQSPQTSQPACRARRFRYYVVSSTWRNNASLFEPTGKIVAQVKWPAGQRKIESGALTAPPDNLLVQEVDLSYAIVGWAAALKNGEGLRALYGDKVGYRYYEDEDCGMFWSNDPRTPVLQMLRRLGLAEQQEEYRQADKVYRQAGVPGY